MSEFFRKPIVKTLMLKGQEGQSIKGIEKTGTDVLVDTYTITLTDGTTSTFTVTNGKGISSLEKTGKRGLVDTYTITFNDSTTSTFTVTNGKEILSIDKTGTDVLVDTYTIEFNDGTTSTFTVTNGKGISNISKTETSGLVDTYTIEFNDSTTSTFTVTNGDSAYKPAVEALGKRIDNLILSSGTESSAEVVDARNGYEGTTYDTLGTAIRSQVSELKGDLNSKIIHSVNLFDYKKSKSGYYHLNQGDTIENSLNENSNYMCNVVEVKPNTTYTINYTNYYVFMADKDRVRTGGILGSGNGVYNLVITTSGKAKYLCVSFPKVNNNSTMVVEGEEMPSEYVPYENTLYSSPYLTNYDLIEIKNNINNLNNNVQSIESELLNSEIAEIYHVGSDKEYTKLYDCLRALQGNENKKIIYIHSGVYDLFDEIGGVEFINAITDSTAWADCNVFVPHNTSIIGVGNVTLNYLPTSEQATVASAGRISPINCRGTIHMENITINAQNCRYCIHDESSSGYEEAVHTYKNVNANFLDGGVMGSPSGICFGCGFSPKTVFEFDNCKFVAKRASSGSFYMHNWKSTEGALITLKNCIMKSPSMNSSNALQFGNSHANTNIAENLVSIDNCYLFGKVAVINGNPSTPTANNFKIISLNSNANIGIDETNMTNTFDPEVYDYKV